MSRTPHAPADGVEMACTHTAAMTIFAKLDAAFATGRRIAAFGADVRVELVHRQYEKVGYARLA